MAHPSGIRREADMWRTFFDKVETEGLDYAISDYSAELTAIDTTMRALVQSYTSSRQEIERYLAARRADPDLDLSL